MKTINKILLVILAFLGISCQKDYEFNEDIVQEYVTTSFGNKATQDLKTIVFRNFHCYFAA